MLSGMQTWIDHRPGDGLIVLHQMGNQVPAVLWFGSLDYVNGPQLRKHVHDYDASAAHWIWDRHEANGKAVLYDGVRTSIRLYAAGLIIALVIGYRRGWSEFVRKGLWIALLTIVLLPSLVGGLKKVSNLACPRAHVPTCPRALVDYGGEVPFIHLFDSRSPETNEDHQCFPAGHASGGFALLALPLLSRSPRRRGWLLAEALTFGWGMNEEVTVVSIRWILLPTGI